MEEQTGVAVPPKPAKVIELTETVGNMVYIFHNGKVKHKKIVEVRIEITDEGESIRYKMDGLTKLVDHGLAFRDRKQLGLALVEKLSE